MKKIKKLNLNMDTISNLTDKKMENINGGAGTMQMTGNFYCTESRGGNCTSFAGTGTGYGMCCCNATGYCS